MTNYLNGSDFHGMVSMMLVYARHYFKIVVKSYRFVIGWFMTPIYGN